MSFANICPLCGVGRSNNELKSFGHRVYFNCERCGQFGAHNTIYEGLGALPLNTRRSLVKKLSDLPKPRFGETYPISDDDIDTASRQRIRTTEMADRLLTRCVKNSQSLGQAYRFDDLDLIKSCFALNIQEMQTLVNFLLGLGYAQLGQSHFEISPTGYQYIEEGGRVQGASEQAFVAMWFDPIMDEVFNSGFQKAIADSGYVPFRIDQKEHNRKIDDEIIAEIRNSKFLIADFTGHRGGVYFEAGFAMGLGLPIIWTCRHDDVPNLHFDIRQYNCIDWTSSEEIRGRLSNRIVALLGRGGVRASNDQSDNL